MDALKDLFVKKCSDFACEPVQALLDDLSAAKGACLTSIQLNGNSKRLFNNRVGYMQVCALCEALYEDANVVSIDLSYNRLNDMAAQAVARLIKVNRTVRFINLAGNDITHVGATQLADALSMSSEGSAGGPVLQVLMLSGNPLEDQGVVALGNMLRSNSSLAALDLCNTGAGIQGIISVCTALGEANQTLSSLDLGSPTLKGPQDTTTLNIARMLASNTSLTELGLSKHGLTDDAFDTLVSYGLLRNRSVTSLDLRANRLSPFSGPTLERLLNDSHQLHSLNLASNRLGDQGALSLARSLPYTHWLQKLDMRSNNIGEQGLVALAEALSFATHLQEFLVWGNSFGPAASRAMLDTLSATAQQGQALVVDIKPYEVDGRAQVALLNE
mmetsp:Transcript_5148/g.11205  ORF Transcript_5148/g.11205 Transcript_5148/m.11205 type:complete len:387 (-) Transcript_5148:369-1529(-)|eukprot:CAMPEP_0202910904 /NCGR_PEP_ID=MMETSP1392-20130828/53373_1 /ASSEMBLY_ACC=CAM_ASM_000868 /TAXON_ID=225041 /ORGANISM="Chlamydomonas chlamydogama, Strain SAG 11-48b" /LENGTH=386 /DNA_ID=CAMNT_0049601183 /DNA_START=106 /DNA_END=1266 /DNA_ORIENTATION=+